MKQETKALIETVIRTLNTISVSGKNNIDMLLGSIIALESIMNEPSEEAKENGC